MAVKRPLQGISRRPKPLISFSFPPETAARATPPGPRTRGGRTYERGAPRAAWTAGLLLRRRWQNQGLRMLMRPSRTCATHAREARDDGTGSRAHHPALEPRTQIFLAGFSADYLPAQAGKGAARLLYIPASSLIGRAICGRVIHWKHKAESYYPILSGTSWRASTMSRQAA